MIWSGKDQAFAAVADYPVDLCAWHASQGNETPVSGDATTVKRARIMTGYELTPCEDDSCPHVAVVPRLLRGTLVKFDPVTRWGFTEANGWRCPAHLSTRSSTGGEQ